MKNILVFYDILISNRGIGKYEHYYNTGNLLIGILMGLKYTAINGIFIIYLLDLLIELSLNKGMKKTLDTLLPLLEELKELKK